MRLRAVRSYGEGVMAAINEGRVDPFALRALAGAGASKRPAPSLRVGFAAGGSVSGAVAAPAGGPSMAVLVSNDQTLDRLLKGGRSAMLRFLREYERLGGR